MPVPDPAVAVTEAEVRRSVREARTHLERAAEEVIWQIEHETWLILGYDSWDDMREGEYGGAACMVPSGTRPRLVARLRSLPGMTQQRIADTIGVSHQTVGRDLNVQTDNVVPPTVTNSRGQQRPASYAKPDREPVASRRLDLGPVDDPEFCRHINDARRAINAAVKHAKGSPQSDHVPPISRLQSLLAKYENDLRAVIYRSDPGESDSSEPECEAVTRWSRRVEQVSADVPMTDLTDDEVRWLGGAADYLRDYCNGELITRRWGVTPR